MRTGVLALAAVTLGSLASAQNTTTGGGNSTAGADNSTVAYATGLFAALNSAGLTYLSGSIGALPEAIAIAGLLRQGNNTVLAPSNAAFASALNFTDQTLQDPSALNASLLFNVISYHVLKGNFAPAQIANGTHTIARTLLTNESYVNLPGQNASQVVVLTKTGANNITILEANDTPRVTANATYQNLQIYVIDTLLTPPGNIESVAPKNFPVLGSALESFGLGPALNAIEGITLFAPQDSALSAALPALTGLNQTVATAVLSNHVINGTVGYSTVLTNGQNLTSASGEPLRVLKNDTGVFVVSGNVTAKVLRADIPLKNGVLHIIDQVLLNTASNPQAAASAASVYASVAATQTPGTGAVGGGSGSGGASASASASASARPAGAAPAGLKLNLASHGLVAVGLFAGALAVFA